ncbi:MAG: FAD-dependent oxidoreductase [Candidatus Cloacimonetes bacterium]|nr:FAD-dependent oxidoreductase [Candidatus Cloacimonadota bacterium]
MIKIKLNDKEIVTEPGKTILDVAREHGINIPTLCHDQDLKPFGSCWVCAVQVKNRRGFVTACGTEILDGMEIITDSEEIRKARKMALELLLSDHYADCEAPCKIACPDQVDVQTYVSLIANGQYHEAIEVIKENLPMPLSIGRVCPAFCETECRRSLVDQPVAIRQLKRFAADFDLNDSWSFVPEKESDKDQKVAIIGAGPSGLTCGYYLSNKGYQVTVFESAEKAGGWLRYGIPEYRLPKTVLDKEIELMCRNGMKIQTGIQIGRDITLSELSTKYNAVYLALGAQNAVPMKIKGGDLKGCYLGVDFLREHAMGDKPKLGRKVAVVGGGNTAIDCARTARRLGSDVTIVYRRTRKEMPAEAYEVDAAEEEGVKFHFLTNPVENFVKKGKLSSIKLEKMKLGKPDNSGRRRPEPTGEFFEEEYDNIISAISQAPEITFLADQENRIEGKELPLTRWSTIETDPAMYTGIGNIFAGGDFRRGPATAIEAIADGRIAAQSISRFLQGELLFDAVSEFDAKKEKELKLVDPFHFRQYQKVNRFRMPELEPDDRNQNFKEVELGYKEKDARSEAERCLECGCLVNTTCDLRKYATEYEIDVSLFGGDKNKHPIDESHPFILRDPNRCIKCGRCVRICAEIQGPGVLGYIYRGFTSMVAPEFGESLKNTTCESCGKCIEVCPVGALVPRNINYKLNPHSLEKITQNCGLCSTGCQIDVYSQTDRIAYIKPAEDNVINNRNLCFSGKFGWQMLEDKDRISHAYLRIEENLENKDKTWKKFHDFREAQQIIKKNLDAAQTKKIYISPLVTNEEIMLMQNVAKNIGASISSLSLPNSFTGEIFKTDLVPKTLQDLEEAEVIFIIGKLSPVIKTLAREQQRKGKKMILVTNEKKDFNNFADELFDEDPIADTLNRILEYYSEDNEIDLEREDKGNAIELDLPKKTLFIYAGENISEEAGWNLWMLAAIVCDFSTGSGVFPTSIYGNRAGLQELGIKPGKPESSDFVLLYGELPCEDQKKMLKNSRFILSVDTHLDDANPGHLVLPLTSYLEINGTALASDGRLLEFKNPKKSDRFQKYLNNLLEMDLIKPEQVKPEYWQEKVKEFFSKPRSKKPMTDQQLFDYLNAIENVKFDVHKQNNLQKKRIEQLRKRIKQ